MVTAYRRRNRLSRSLCTFADRHASGGCGGPYCQPLLAAYHRLLASDPTYSGDDRCYVAFDAKNDLLAVLFLTECAYERRLWCSADLNLHGENDVELPCRPRYESCGHYA